MKIYINGLQPHHITLSDLSNKEEIIKNIYTPEGIYKIHKDQIYKGTVDDKTIQYQTLGKYSIWIDNSDIQFNTPVHYISHQHIYNQTNKNYYTITDNLQLIIETSDMFEQSVVYFKTSVSMQVIQKTLHTFLCEKVNI